MTQHAEVIYETGAHSVVSIDNMDEFKAGLREHHRRAMAGEPGQADVARPAERIKKVILYNDHPSGNDPHNDSVDGNAVATLASGMTQPDGKLPAHQLIQALRDEMSPVYPVSQGVHESMYKENGTEMTDLSFLGGDAA